MEGLLFGTGAHIWKDKQKQKPTLFLTKQCWYPRYKVPVLFKCGGCHPEEFIIASFYNFKYIANNHDNNSDNNDTNNKLRSCTNFHLHNFYFPVSISCINFIFLLNKIFFICCLVSPEPLFEEKVSNLEVKHES